jgi:putative transcriptional regulator
MKKYKSPVLRHIHQEAAVLYKHGMISAAKMREFDHDCLVPSTVAASPAAGRRPAISASPGPARGRNAK